MIENSIVKRILGFNTSQQIAGGTHLAGLLAGGIIGYRGGASAEHGTAYNTAMGAATGGVIGAAAGIGAGMLYANRKLGIAGVGNSFMFTVLGK